MSFRTPRFRVVVDGNPALAAPVTRFEQRISPLGWKQVTEGAAEFSKQHNRWTCRIQSSDDRADYDYEIDIKTPCNVAELNQIMQGYAKNILDGVDASKVTVLKLTAETIN